MQKKEKIKVKMKKNKKGTVALYFTFLVTALIIILISAVFAPMGIMFNVKMYEAGETILSQSQDEINNIQDTEIRNSINSSITSAKTGLINNIEVNSALFQYGWIIIIILTGLIIFLYTRRLTELNTGIV